MMLMERMERITAWQCSQQDTQLLCCGAVFVRHALMIPRCLLHAREACCAAGWPIKANPTAPTPSIVAPCARPGVCLLLCRCLATRVFDTLRACSSIAWLAAMLTHHAVSLTWRAPQVDTRNRCHIQRRSAAEYSDWRSEERAPLSMAPASHGLSALQGTSPTIPQGTHRSLWHVAR
jgi:hypothetical protein